MMISLSYLQIANYLKLSNGLNKKSEKIFKQVYDHIIQDICNEGGDVERIDHQLLREGVRNAISYVLRKYKDSHRTFSHLLSSPSLTKLSVPIVIKDNVEVTQEKHMSNPIRSGRPRKSFRNLKPNSQRMVTRGIRKVYESEAIVQAAVEVTKNEGNKNQSKIIKESGDSEKVTQMIDVINSPMQSELTAVEALHLILDLNL